MGQNAIDFWIQTGSKLFSEPLLPPRFSERTKQLSVAEPFDFGAAPALAPDLAPAPTLNQQKLNILFLAKSIFDF